MAFTHSIFSVFILNSYKSGTIIPLSLTQLEKLKNVMWLNGKNGYTSFLLANKSLARFTFNLSLYMMKQSILTKKLHYYERLFYLLLRIVSGCHPNYKTLSNFLAGLLIFRMTEIYSIKTLCISVQLNDSPALCYIKIDSTSKESYIYSLI